MVKRVNIECFPLHVETILIKIEENHYICDFGESTGRGILAKCIGPIMDEIEAHFAFRDYTNAIKEIYEHIHNFKKFTYP